MLRVKGRNVKENAHVKVRFSVRQRFLIDRSGIERLFDSSLWFTELLKLYCVILQLGAYHTIDLELNRKFKLSKYLWDSVHLDRLQQACDPTKSADVAAVVMQEGIAHVCLVTTSMTLLRAKIDMNIPRKRKGLTSQHDKAMNKFYDAILRALNQHVNFEGKHCE